MTASNVLGIKRIAWLTTATAVLAVVVSVCEQRLIRGYWFRPPGSPLAGAVDRVIGVSQLALTENGLEPQGAERTDVGGPCTRSYGIERLACVDPEDAPQGKLPYTVGNVDRAALRAVWSAAQRDFVTANANRFNEGSIVSGYAVEVSADNKRFLGLRFRIRLPEWTKEIEAVYRMNGEVAELVHRHERPFDLGGFEELGEGPQLWIINSALFAVALIVALARSSGMIWLRIVGICGGIVSDALASVVCLHLVRSVVSVDPVFLVLAISVFSAAAVSLTPKRLTQIRRPSR